MSGLGRKRLTTLTSYWRDGHCQMGLWEGRSEMTLDDAGKGTVRLSSFVAQNGGMYTALFVGGMEQAWQARDAKCEESGNEKT